MSMPVQAFRTNYFRVKDAEAFEEFLEHVFGEYKKVDVFKRTDAEGRTLYGFGDEGALSGYLEDLETREWEEDAVDVLFEKLQEHVAEEDAIIILLAGHEKLRDVYGDATIITAKDIEYIELKDAAIAMARSMLEKPDWDGAADNFFLSGTRILSKDLAFAEDAEIVVSNIEWDTEDGGENLTAEEAGLPENVIIPLKTLVDDYDLDPSEREMLEDYIGDYLADQYAYCVYGFQYDIKE